MSDVEELREGLLECVEKSKEVQGMALLNMQMSAELAALLNGLWGQGAPNSPDFMDMVRLAMESRTRNEEIIGMMKEFVGKALDYSSRL